MTCAEAEARFSAFLDGTLGEEACTAFEVHIMGCVGCREGVAAVKGVTDWLARAPCVAVPEGLATRVFAAMADADDCGAVVPPVRQPLFVLECGEAREVFTGALEEQLDPEERAAFQAHIIGCESCALEYRQFVAVVQLLARAPSLPTPNGLEAGVREALRRESEVQTSDIPRDVGLRVVTPPAGRRWMHAWSAMGGAIATAAALFVWSLLPGVGVPRLEAKTVSVSQDVAVHIQFEADERLDGVVFQVDLPEGLQFIDDGSAPLLARSVSWRGALEKGKTVVPIVVRGSRPGNYTIEAVVRKGPLLRRTAVVLPVEG